MGGVGSSFSKIGGGVILYGGVQHGKIIRSFVLKDLRFILDCRGT